jgi:tetratricopeptide (TPR) repeat protein
VADEVNDLPRPAGSAPSSTEARGEPGSPLILIPVTADDVARRKRRVFLKTASVVLVMAALGYVLYRRSIDPMNALQAYDSGQRLLTIGRYQQAILSFDRATHLKPDFADAYMMRGKAEVFESKTVNAIRDFSKVLELRPNDSPALAERSAAYLDYKDFKLALADANTALSLDPKMSRAYNLRGSCERALGDPRKALEDFTRAIELHDNEDNYFQRGATYQLMGEHGRAISDFNEVILRKPDESPAYFARAESKRAIGDERGAVTDHRTGRKIEGQR